MVWVRVYEHKEGVSRLEELIMSESEDDKVLFIHSRARSSEDDVELSDTAGEMSESSRGSESHYAVPDDLLKTYYFGCRGFHPRCLQVLASKKFFAFILCLFTLIEGAVVSGFFPVVLSTLEKRYHISSTESGFLFSVYEIAVIIAVVFTSYLGGKTHKPRFLAISLVVFGSGSVLFASPQIILGQYDVNSTKLDTTEVCSASSGNSSGDPSCTVDSNRVAYSILVIAEVVLGLGASGLFTVGAAYLDEIVHPRYVSVYMGTFLIPSIIGPALGFGLASAFLFVYVDPWVGVALEETDPRWVGAWWMGYLLMGLLCYAVSVPFFMFPKWLPDSHLVRKERLKEMAKKYPGGLTQKENWRVVIKMFPVHMKRLMTNVPFVLSCLGISATTFSKDGIVTYGPHILESVFGMSASASGLYAGGIGITMAALGAVTGALIMYKFKLNGRKTAVIPWVVLGLSVPASFMAFIKCPTLPVAGITTSYPDGMQNGTDYNDCFSHCHCVSNQYEPVCGADGVTYYSPCRAGCVLNTTTATYIDCTCIEQSLDTTNTTNIGTAEEGQCHVSCGHKFVYFIIAVAIFIYFVLIPVVPFYHLTLRMVSDDQRHLSLGVQSAIYRVLGSIPGLLVYGAMFDTSCARWEDVCGNRGNCVIYDNDKLGIRLFAATIASGGVATLLMFLTWITYPKQSMQEYVIVSNNNDVILSSDEVSNDVIMSNDDDVTDREEL